MKHTDIEALLFQHRKVALACATRYHYPRHDYQPHPLPPMDRANPFSKLQLLGEFSWDIEYDKQLKRSAGRSYRVLRRLAFRKGKL